MKILLVISLGYVAGGAESSVQMMKRELTARGHEVRVLSAHTPDQELYSEYTFEPVSKQSPFKFLHHIFYFRSYVAMRRAIRDFQPDVVHFHTLTALTPSVLLATGRVPSVMTIHGPEEFTLRLLPWFMDDQDFRHNTFDTAHLTPRGRLKYLYYTLVQRPVYRLGLRRLRLVIAPSAYMMSATRGDFGSTPMQLIYNGTYLPSPQPLRHHHNLLFAGRLERLKGAEYLVRAFAELHRADPKLSLRIVGDGPHRRQLEQLAAQLGVGESCRFTGWVGQDQLAREYADATVVVVPSVCPEALGLVGIEALATGRPLITTQMGGLPELVQPGRTGYTVPPADPAALAGAIRRVITAPNLAAMSTAAAKSAQPFNAAVFIDELAAAYQRVAGRPQAEVKPA